MIYTGTELLWLFLIYSFLGWILETVSAAVKQKRFVNRGLVNAPFCVLYGMAAVFITVFGAELQGIWLYFGSVIMATVFEWIAGHLIERFYRERWWDYSGHRYHLDGYISLKTSAFWGVLACIMMKWGNAGFLYLFEKTPKFARRISIGLLCLILMIDVIATLVILSGKSSDIKRWKNVDQRLSRWTNRLGYWIYRRINKRIKRAYPESFPIKQKEKHSDIFACGCSFYKIVWIFVIGSFLGDITEMIFCRIRAGIWMSRSSVVWGPFSIVWGLAMAAVTILLYRYRNRSDRFLFLAGTFLGGAYEYVCSVFTELAFGKIFWDYSKIPFNLGGRINLLYCFFWGFAAIVWLKVLYPWISDKIEKIPVKTGKMITGMLIIFMSCNMIVSAMALIRSTERMNGIPAEHCWQQIMDERFGDERLARIYPNMINIE